MLCAKRTGCRQGSLAPKSVLSRNSPPVPPIDLRRSSIERQIYGTRSSVLSIHLPIDGVALIEQLVERRQFESTSLTSLWKLHTQQWALRFCSRSSLAGLRKKRGFVP